MIDIHSDQTMMHKWTVWNRAALNAHARPVDIPDADLGIGIYFENMGPVVNPYLGALGRIRSATVEPAFTLEDVAPKHMDPVSPEMFAPTGYLGEPWGV